MNELLKKLYTSKWSEISNMLQSFNEEEPDDFENLATHPLLIKTDKEYEASELKVMFFGQETNYWGGEYNNGVFKEGIDVDSLLNLYNQFYLEKGYEEYGKPFWNFIRKLKSSEADKKVGYVWNNVLKIGKCESGTPQQGLINYAFEYFNVIPQEIEILKPNLLLFLSGHNYDEYIRKSVGNFTKIPVEGFSTNELCKFEFESIPVKLALRTYHPGFLQRLGKEKLDKISDTISQTINSQ